MCEYVQSTTFGLTTKPESFEQYNEFSTQVAFVASLQSPDLYTKKMELPVHMELNNYKFVKSWYDAVVFEKRDNSNPLEKKKCILFEFKNKNIKYLQVGVEGI
jgi:hypothetical protein